MNRRIEDKRSHPRIPITLTVQLRWGDNSPRFFKTRDICDNGVFLLAGQAPFPPLGSELSIKVMEDLDGEDPPWVKGIVVREDEEGIGIQLLG